MIRVLIVDDELPARERLRRLLGGMEGVEIAGEAVDGITAIEQIAQSPDVVLLDIEMPGCRGTEVAASLAEPRPAIIFCTAYDQFAVEAFELRALDYLLKPVSRQRLCRGSPARPRAAAGVRQAAARAALPGPRWRALRGDSHRLRCGISIRGRIYETLHARPRILDGTDVERVGGSAWTRRSRASRAAIIRMDEVKEVLPMPGGNGEVAFEIGPEAGGVAPPV